MLLVLCLDQTIEFSPLYIYLSLDQTGNHGPRISFNINFPIPMNLCWQNTRYMIPGHRGKLRTPKHGCIAVQDNLFIYSKQKLISKQQVINDSLLYFTKWQVYSAENYFIKPTFLLALAMNQVTQDKKANLCNTVID